MKGSEVIIDAIAKQEWLEELAEPLQNAVREILPRGEIKNLLHGTWFGHPLHAAIVSLPVGAWTAAAAFDLIGADDAADLAIGVGLLGAVGSAVTGLADWSETDDPGRTIGVAHAGLNVAATLLYTASYFMRRSEERRDGAVALSMLGYALSSAAAFLGGHLVFGEQIGVDHTATADARKPKKFKQVMAASDLRENKPTYVEADGVGIVLVKRDERIYALSATCPHLGGPLAEGKLVGDAIQCPWHQSELALDDGHVVNGPTTFPARRYEVRVHSGQIEVRAARISE